MKMPARPLLLLALAALAAIAAQAQAADAPAAKTAALPEAAIPFADHGGINNWETDGSRGLWVESVRHQWYYGTFATPCSGLATAETIRFKFSPSGSLDRYSTIATRDTGGECWFKSFTKSAGPPHQDPGSKAGKGDKASTAKPADKPAAGQP
jgi:hypothetical protein